MTHTDILEAVLDETISIQEAKILVESEVVSGVGSGLNLTKVGELQSKYGDGWKDEVINFLNKKFPGLRLKIYSQGGTSYSIEAMGSNEELDRYVDYANGSSLFT